MMPLQPGRGTTPSKPQLLCLFFSSVFSRNLCLPWLKRRIDGDFCRGYAGGSRLYAYRRILIPLSKIEPYRVYRVKKGDTLIGLAGRFNTRRDSISVLNHIWTPSGLRAGRRILVLLDRIKK
ncbi:MAG: LysM peptidoglycan-binding domain-containing protein [bacterium]|nr:LysM peptidoglycan-binding domain-containing protein [bacterium]